MTETDIVVEPGKQEVLITTFFDAPRYQVFNAYIDPQLIPQWWGPRNLTTTVETWEVRPGGSWRVIQSDSEGNEYSFHGVFHEVIEPERITWTFEYEAMPGHVSLETVTFEERDGKTKVTTKSIFQSVEDRDGAIESGMTEGVAESNERLTEILAKAA